MDRHWTELLATSDIPSINAELLRHIEEPGMRRLTPPGAPPRPNPAAGCALGKIVDVDGHGRPVRMLGVTQDVTHQREQTHVLEQMAHFDALTGLANRLHLTARLKDSTRIARHDAGQLGVVYIDLDGFKPINDRLGHDVGDQLLVQVAKRLKSALRSRTAWPAWVAMNSSSCSTGWKADRTAKPAGTHHAAPGGPYILGADTARITASMGYTLYPEDDADEDTLLRHADQAMYQAKQSGRNCVRAFDSVTERQMRAQQADTLRVREGLERGEFTLYCSPRWTWCATAWWAWKAGTLEPPHTGVLAPAPSCRWWKALRWTSPLANGPCARPCRPLPSCAPRAWKCRSASTSRQAICSSPGSRTG
jgi:GGDEF domain-containing protein